MEASLGVAQGTRMKDLYKEMQSQLRKEGAWRKRELIRTDDIRKLMA